MYTKNYRVNVIKATHIQMTVRQRFKNIRREIRNDDIHIFKRYKKQDWCLLVKRVFVDIRIFDHFTELKNKKDQEKEIGMNLNMEA